jgi:hypothetical protein
VVTDGIGGSDSIVGLGRGYYAKLRNGKSAVGARVLWDMGVLGGLTCDFWAVFGGGWGRFIFGGTGTGDMGGAEEGNLVVSPAASLQLDHPCEQRALAGVRFCGSKEGPLARL